MQSGGQMTSAERENQLCGGTKQTGVSRRVYPGSRVATRLLGDLGAHLAIKGLLASYSARVSG